MRIRRTISWRMLDAELWHALFASIKAAFLAVATIFRAAALVLYFIAQNVAWAAEWLYQLIVTWHPVKPAAFQFENRKDGELVIDALAETITEGGKR